MGHAPPERAALPPARCHRGALANPPGGRSGVHQHDPHLAPWQAAEGLFAGAARILAPGGLLALYGPYRRAGQPMEPGNAAFDAGLRSQNPAWALREVETVAELAARSGFGAPEIVAMPADNLMLLFRA